MKTKEIPKIEVEHLLRKKFTLLLMVGSPSVLEKKDFQYLRVLVRLIDKSITEYNEARHYSIKINEGDNQNLKYNFGLINNLENSINALNRVRKCWEKISKCSEDLYLSNFVPQKIKKYNFYNVRNRTEHIADDILKEKVTGPLWTTVQNGEVKANYESLKIDELKKAIEEQHNIVLDVFNSLPNRMTNGVYYNNEKKISYPNLRNNNESKK